MKRAEKEKIVEALHEKFSKAKSVLLTDFRGLNTSDMGELRGRLREASVEYRVVKNTLMLRASEGTDMALIKDHFVGPCGVALTYDDPVAPAKVLTKFIAEKPALEIRVGMLEGKVVDAEGIKRLAELPSREGLLSQLLSVFNGPATALVIVLTGVQREFLGVLEAIKEQKEAA